MKVRDLLQITTVERASPQDAAVIRNGILSFNHANYGEKPKFFTVLLKSNDGQVYGGATAYAHTSSIFVDVLWVDEKYRGQGYGSQLLTAAEKEAKRRGAKYLTIDTFGFQAEPFYLKMGYYHIGKIKNYIQGFDRIFLRKNLDGSAPTEEDGAIFE